MTDQPLRKGHVSADTVIGDIVARLDDYSMRMGIGPAEAREGCVWAVQVIDAVSRGWPRVRIALASRVFGSWGAS